MIRDKGNIIWDKDNIIRGNKYPYWWEYRLGTKTRLIKPKIVN